MPDGCHCPRLCFLCQAAEDMKPHKAISAKESAKLYWSEKAAGRRDGTIHPTVSEAVEIGHGLCEQAWAALKDKRDAQGHEDSTPLRDPAAFFIHALKENIAAFRRDQKARKNEKLMAFKASKARRA